uniref:Large ribosomal subunit protein uL22c n=1 Tax=Rhodochaete parvula TaxID=110510 RepID=A0A1X9PUZ9_9RHOD|nr:50S ribosomal protein L22 [Rhodochaete parvula]
MNPNNNIIEVKATAKYLRTSSVKVRRVLDQIRGRKYKEAMMILEFMPYRCCNYIYKILKSAASNANHNHNLQTNDLLITQAYANEGPVMKRFQPRAQGRAYKILKPTCHISIYVGITN